MQTILRLWVALLCTFNLTACQPDNSLPALTERPPELLKTAHVEIEMPRYLVFGQIAQIKLKLIAPKDYRITGDLYINDVSINGFNSSNHIWLDAQTSERIVEYTPDFRSAEFAKVDIKAKFKGNDSDNYTATTYSQVTPLYMHTLYAGPAQTIKAGTQEQLNVKANRLLEEQIGDFSNFTWKQVEGPTVQLIKKSDRDVEFTAPEVNEVTKLRFSITSSIEGGNTTHEAEKVVYVVPSNLWLRTIKTFQQNLIAVREDGSAVVIPWQWGGYNRYQLSEKIEEISDIIADYSATRMIVLYKNGTVKFIKLDPTANIQTTIKDDSPKEPITNKNYSIDGIFFRANNIKEIVMAEGYDSVYVKTFDDQYFVLDYGMRELADKTYEDFATLKQAPGVYPYFHFFEFSLSDSGELNGLFFNSFTDTKITTPFSMLNVGLFSPLRPLPYDKALFGYLLKDNSPGFLSAIRRTTTSGQKPDESPLPIRNEMMKKSPFQTSPFVDVLPFGRHEEIYLLEANGNVSSYREGIWEDYPYLKNISEIGAMAIRKDGTSILWAEPDQSLHSNTYVAKIRRGVDPNPANIKGADLETLIE